MSLGILSVFIPRIWLPINTLMHSMRRLIRLVETKVWKLNALAPNSVSQMIAVKVMENPTWPVVQTLLQRSHYDAIKGCLAGFSRSPAVLMWAEDVTHTDIEEAFMTDQGIDMVDLADFLLLGSDASLSQKWPNMQFPVLLYRNRSVSSDIASNRVIRNWPCQVINAEELPDHMQDEWL